MNMLGIAVISPKDGVNLATLKSFRTELRPGTSQFVAGNKLVLIHGRISKVLYKADRTINSIKSHFDNEYTIKEWAVDVEGSYYAVKQLFRYTVAEDFDSQSEFVIVWTRLDRDKLHEYIDGLFYGCSCSYDCCGHWFTNLWTHKTKKFGPIAIVFLGHGRNV
jgi:hypothetical protein